MKIEITTPLSHQTTTCEMTTLSAHRVSNSQNYGDQLMQGLERATDYREHRDILITHLEKLEKSAQLTIPLSIRPAFFHTANNLVSHLYLTYTQDKSLYQTCFKFLSQINLQIDHEEQNNEKSNENEWEELQRAVFLLTEWEKAIFHKSTPQQLYAQKMI